MKRPGISGPGVLAIVTSVACILAVLSIVILVGLLPSDELLFVPTWAQ